MPLNVQQTAHAPRIEVKQSLDDPSWTLLPNAEPIEVSAAVPSHDLSTARFRHRYGEIIPIGGTAYQQISPLDIRNYWCRVQYNYGTDGSPSWQTIFLGRIVDETKEVHGTTTIPSGIQQFAAYGPYYDLMRTHVSTSQWWQDPDRFEIGWLPPMNATDDRNIIVGNRSTSVHDGGYHVYSDEAEEWNAVQYIEYLLHHYGPGQTEGVSWQLSGDATAISAVEQFTEPVIFRDNEDVASIIHNLVSRLTGLDWFILSEEIVGGVEHTVYIFSLVAQDITYGSATLSKNPRQVSFDAQANPLVQSAVLEESQSQRYGAIRVFGQRLVVCGSFQRGSTSTQIDDCWLATVETEYEDGTGDSGDDARTHDDYRASDKFRDVYQRFYVSLLASDLADKYFPSVDPELGTISFTSRSPNQVHTRETLSWTPIKQGYDHTVDPPSSETVDEAQDVYLPPMVFLQRAGAASEDPYVLAEWASTGVSPLPTQWGVQLSSFPNHAIADGEFTSTNDTEVEPTYEFDRMIMTLAWRADVRCELFREVSGNSPGVRNIFVPEAETWVIAPTTVVGLDSDNQPEFSPDTGIVVRNDLEKLEQVMVGAIARYQIERFRASLVVKGIFDWEVNLGAILLYVYSGSSDQVGGPITKVTWQFDRSHMTTLKAGYAR